MRSEAGPDRGRIGEMARAERSATYLRDPDEIYRASFAAIREAAAVDRLPRDVQPVALRLVHACGMTDIVDDLAFTPDAVAAGQAALAAGRPILVDATMVAAGIQTDRLSTGSEIVCTLNHPNTSDLAKATGTTRSAAAVELWRPHLEGAVVAIGNAPTALFRLLELLEDGAPPPAVILGFPVGFVGAVESKDALIAADGPLSHIALRGRRGGSALAAAAVNALISKLHDREQGDRRR